MFDFLWSRTATNNKSSKVSKTDAVKPQNTGGLAMVNIPTYWQSLHLTWLRKLTTSNAFWVKILKLELNRIGFHINNILYASSHELLHISRNTTNPHWAAIFKTASHAL